MEIKIERAQCLKQWCAILRYLHTGYNLGTHGMGDIEYAASLAWKLAIKAVE